MTNFGCEEADAEAMRHADRALALLAEKEREIRDRANADKLLSGV